MTAPKDTKPKARKHHPPTRERELAERGHPPRRRDRRGAPHRPQAALGGERDRHRRVPRHALRRGGRLGRRQARALQGSARLGAAFIVISFLMHPVHARLVRRADDRGAGARAAAATPGRGRARWRSGSTRRNPALMSSLLGTRQHAGDRGRHARCEASTGPGAPAATGHHRRRTIPRTKVHGGPSTSLRENLGEEARRLRALSLSVPDVDVGDVRGTAVDPHDVDLHRRRSRDVPATGSCTSSPSESASASAKCCRRWRRCCANGSSRSSSRCS